MLTGAAVGAVAGEAAQSQRQGLRYPDTISIPMACGGGDATRPARALGVTVGGLTLPQAQALGLAGRTAVIVLAVAAAGPAAAAGLLPGDVVVALDGRDLHDAADLAEQVSARPPDAPLALRVWRDRRWSHLLLRRDP